MILTWTCTSQLLVIAMLGGSTLGLDHSSLCAAWCVTSKNVERVKQNKKVGGRIYENSSGFRGLHG